MTAKQMMDFETAKITARTSAGAGVSLRICPRADGMWDWHTASSEGAHAGTSETQARAISAAWQLSPPELRRMITAFCPDVIGRDHSSSEEEEEEAFDARIGASDLVVNVKAGDKYEVFIGRPSQWGNPIRLREDTLSERFGALLQYLDWLTLPAQAALRARVVELRGQVLGCYCAPAPCHGHVLARLANASDLDAELKSMRSQLLSAHLRSRQREAGAG